MSNTNIAENTDKIIRGRRIKNKSLKLLEHSEESYSVIYSFYLFGLRLIKSRKQFTKKGEAERFYDHLAFAKFKGKLG